jgi:hypothetical protein
MTVTIKQVEAAIDKYEGLVLFLAGVRSTMHELASVGKKHYERAEKAEDKLVAAELKMSAMRVYLTHLPLCDLHSTSLAGVDRVCTCELNKIDGEKK